MTPQSAFAVHLTDGVYRHEPENVDAHRLQARNVFGKSVECTFRSMLTDVHFVYGRIF